MFTETWDRLVEAVISRRSDPPLVGQVTLPEEDPLPETDRPTGNVYGAAEGQYFIIEYIDSKGQESRRRVTVYSVVPGAAGMPCLFARCHERKADRQFRFDRIQCVIDMHGEVHEDVLDYLCEGLGLDKESVTAAFDGSVSKKSPAVVNAAREFAMALVTVADCDGHRHTAEFEAILLACVKRCDRLRIDVDATELEHLKRYILRLRPTDDMFRNAVGAIMGMPPREVVEFLLACRKVAEADTRLHADELRLLDALSRDLTGVSN